MTDVLSAAAEPHRRRILQLLASGPRSVNELASQFTSTRSATSQHLLVLQEAGLVSADKVGRRRIYRVLPSGLSRLQAEIDRFWTTELDRLVDDAENLRTTLTTRSHR
jgi:DNA-binding transcriptional ArsR family regulator